MFKRAFFIAATAVLLPTLAHGFASIAHSSDAALPAADDVYHLEISCTRKADFKGDLVTDIMSELRLKDGRLVRKRSGQTGTRAVRSLYFGLSLSGITAVTGSAPVSLDLEDKTNPVDASLVKLIKGTTPLPVVFGQTKGATKVNVPADNVGWCGQNIFFRPANASPTFLVYTHVASRATDETFAQTLFTNAAQFAIGIVDVALSRAPASGLSQDAEIRKFGTSVDELIKLFKAAGTVSEPRPLRLGRTVIETEFMTVTITVRDKDHASDGSTQTADGFYYTGSVPVSSQWRKLVTAQEIRDLNAAAVAQTSCEKQLETISDRLVSFTDIDIALIGLAMMKTETRITRDKALSCLGLERACLARLVTDPRAQPPRPTVLKRMVAERHRFGSDIERFCAQNPATTYATLQNHHLDATANRALVVATMDQFIKVGLESKPGYTPSAGWTKITADKFADAFTLRFSDTVYDLILGTAKSWPDLKAEDAPDPDPIAASRAWLATLDARLEIENGMFVVHNARVEDIAFTLHTSGLHRFGCLFGFPTSDRRKFQEPMFGDLSKLTSDDAHVPHFAGLAFAQPHLDAKGERPALVMAKAVAAHWTAADGKISDVQLGRPGIDVAQIQGYGVNYAPNTECAKIAQ